MRPPSFWEWFFRGPSAGKAGWRSFADWWALLHLAVGVVASYWLPGPLQDAARSVLLPLAGVFVGMSFAWVGNAQALLETREVEVIADAAGAPLADYVYTFQAAILAILVTLVCWGVAALGYFELPCVWACHAWLYWAVKALLFGLASLSLRECWHVVLGAQLLLVSKQFVGGLTRKSDAP